MATTTKIVTYPTFTPTGISNCALWLDASDPTTCLTSGSAVTAWNDKSGNGNNITIGNTSGTAGLTFGNASNLVGSATSVNTASGLTSYFTVNVDLRKTVTPNASVFMVYAWLGSNLGGNQTFWGNDNPNNLNRFQAFSFGGSANFGYLLGSGSYLSNATELNKSTTQLYGLISQVGVTNGTSVFVNGTIGGAGSGTEAVNSPVASNATLYFGGGETASILPSYTQFNEILVYTTALNQTQRQQVEGYLAWKWSLVSLLPANHPFKTTPMYQRIYTPQNPPINSTNVFNPLTVPGCKFWLDAADPSVVTSNANSIVTGVRDKSGNGYNLTNSMTTAGFTWNQTPFNTSYPSFYFNSVTQTYTLGSNSSFTQSQPATIFTVHQKVGTSQYNSLFDGTNGTNRFLLFYYDGPPLTLRLYAGNLLIQSSPSTSAVIYSIQMNTTSSQYFANGTSVATGDVGSLATTGLTIGSQYTQNQETFQGHICEILYYNGSLTTAQRQQIEGYLAWKWGLQANLPSNHPYKNLQIIPVPYQQSVPYKMVRAPYP